MNIPLRFLEEQAFKPYGEIVKLRNDKESFQVIIQEESQCGWRIALSKLSGLTEVNELGIHPNSRESFEPLYGLSVIFVSQYDTPEQIEAFVLDQPICLSKNIWHSTVSLSETSTLKITENAYVKTHSYKLKQSLSIGVVQK